MSKQDVIVVGGGMVGAAIAWGLSRLGMRVVVLDGEDETERASRANFGLVWGQSKGDSLPDYARWTQQSLHLWTEFQDELKDATGVSCAYMGKGGLHLCMSEEELNLRKTLFDRMRRIEGGNSLDLQILDHKETAELMPGLGPEVVGAGYCGQDGHVSPHAALSAVHRGIRKNKGQIVSNSRVSSINYRDGIYRLACANQTYETSKLVLAAGTGNQLLGNMLGLNIPVFGLKGQILVTERVTSRLSLPSHKVRQTEAGTLLLGDSKEPDAGSDDRSYEVTIREIADRAIRMFPWLAHVNLVRAWGGIRCMTEDSYPIYDTYPEYPGLFSANCHSGVTLAPVHSLELAPMIAEGALSGQLKSMSSARFNV